MVQRDSLPEVKRMIINKQIYIGKPNKEEKYFLRLCNPCVLFSAGVRDWIMPHTNVYIDVMENGDFVIIPTSNECGYKITICNGQAKISCRGLLRAMPVKMNARIYCKKVEDGKILCMASKA